MSEFETVIGLEIHVELDTKTKLFCRCSREYGRDPNTQVCPVCLGYPGALPVLNEEAVRKAVLTARALNAKINTKSYFYRKNYFYPDLPKGYQITQYTYSLAEEGFLEFEYNGSLVKVRIERMNLEEEAAKSFHTEEGYALLDFNRSGIPLLEIVTLPDLRSPQEARQFLVRLRQTLRYLGVSQCDMEKGHLRADANVSVRLPGEPLGTKVELKNLNSFKAIEDGLEYEVNRQIEVLKQGGKILQETRQYEEDAGVTRLMRTKEEAHDYRYFPEPDLLPLVIKSEWLEEPLPELPAEKMKRLMRQYGLRKDISEVLTLERQTSEYFEELVKGLSDPVLAANWVVNRVLGYVKESSIDEFLIKPTSLRELLLMVEKSEITLNKAKDIFEKMIETGKSAKQIVQEEGIMVLNDEKFLQDLVDEVLENNPDLREKYLKGKTGVLGPLIGQVMKKTRGNADPQLVRKLLVRALETKR